jgi:hypothetical protein
MTWETTAMIILIMFMATVFITLLSAVFSAAANAKAKRNIELYKAGLMPKGWIQK